ncbi:Mitochondrial import receptor subunit TOM7-like [Cricetulus griseus]|uniref:Mitochondrial import receptor subunit TOM7 homolog n=1 Tax=Cricetulus griseus TaxID=10029 RepID=G3HVW7_CRIGR|nr:Mitochondrial import receptor subunit TOM7-like [Cricetulus griseus]
MVKLSKEAKQRLQQLFKGGQFAIRWGFIPLVIYLGQCGAAGAAGGVAGPEPAPSCSVSPAGGGGAAPALLSLYLR